VPIPDEIPLITIGYMCATHVFHHPFLAAASAFAAFMIIDIVQFWIARSGSSFAARIEAKLKAGWVARYADGIRTRLPKTLFILSFIHRMRSFAPLLAGGIGVPARRFFFYDALSLLFFILIYMSLGFFFHDQVLSIFTHIEEKKHLIFTGVIFVLLMALGYVGYRFRKLGRV